jgi:RNA polymerase sigma-70 factor (ECF subfamily)
LPSFFSVSYFLLFRLLMLPPPATAAFITARELSVRARQDLVLIEAALAGSPPAYEALLDKYRKPVYHLILKLVRHPDDTEDLTLEVFAKAFRHLARYQPQFAFSTWLFRIATNHSIDFIRRSKVKTLSLDAPSTLENGDSLGWEVCDPDPDPQEACIRQQRIALTRQVVSRLPPKYATLVRLRYFEELSYEEVAGQLQLPVGTVKAQLHTARQLMGRLVKDSQAVI